MPRGSEVAKEYPPTGTKVLPKKPDLRVVEKEKELKPKETEKEYRERVGRSRKRKAWTLFGALSGAFGSPAVAVTALEVALRAGSDHPIVQWYEGKIREPIIGGVGSLLIKTPEGENIGEVVPVAIKEIKPPQEEIKVEEKTQKVETSPIATEVKEEQAGPIEYEGVMIPQIEGLSFKEGVYYTQEGNPYGLEAEVKAGVFIKDAFELNGEMENSIALRPEVIEYRHNKILNEEGKILVPLPLDLTGNEGIKMEIVKFARDESYPDFDDTSLIINVPVGTKVYSPLKTERSGYPRSGFGVLDSSSEPNDGWYNFSFYPMFDIYANPNVEDTFTNPFKYGGFEVPTVVPSIWCQGAKLSPQTFQEGNVEEHPRSKGGFVGSSEFGTEMAEIVSEPKQEIGQPPFFSGLCSIEMYLVISEFGVRKIKFTADELILEIDDIKVSILPVHD